MLRVHFEAVFEAEIEAQSCIYHIMLSTDVSEFSVSLLSSSPSSRVAKWHYFVKAFPGTSLQNPLQIFFDK